MPNATLAPTRPERPRTAAQHDQARPAYPARMPNQPEPEIIEAAHQIGVDPQALRDQLDRADLTPPAPEHTDDLPKLLARLAELDQP